MHKHHPGGKSHKKRQTPNLTRLNYVSRKVRWRDKQSCLIRAPPRALQGSPVDLRDLPLAAHPSSSLPAASHPVSFPFLPPILDSTDPSIPTISRQLLFHLCCLHAAHKGSVVARGRSPKPPGMCRPVPKGSGGSPWKPCLFTASSSSVSLQSLSVAAGAGDTEALGPAVPPRGCTRAGLGSAKHHSCLCTAQKRGGEGRHEMCSREMPPFLWYPALNGALKPTFGSWAVRRHLLNALCQQLWPGKEQEAGAA